MRTFLHDVTLLVAVTAAGGVALTYGVRSMHPDPDLAPMLTLAGVAPRRHAPISLSALAIGEEIRVRFTSRGCYHDVDHDFVFTPTASGDVALSHAVRRANLVEGWYFVAPPRLSRSQIAELDALLAYFRAPYPLPDGRVCRAQETVEIALYRDGAEAAMERFTGTCGSPDQETLTFGRLARLKRRITDPPQN